VAEKSDEKQGEHGVKKCLLKNESTGRFFKNEVCVFGFDFKLKRLLLLKL